MATRPPRAGRSGGALLPTQCCKRNAHYMFVYLCMQSYATCFLLRETPFCFQHHEASRNVSNRPTPGLLPKTATPCDTRRGQRVFGRPGPLFLPGRSLWGSSRPETKSSQDTRHTMRNPDQHKRENWQKERKRGTAHRNQAAHAKVTEGHDGQRRGQEAAKWATDRKQSRRCKARRGPQTAKTQSIVSEARPRGGRQEAK